MDSTNAPVHGASDVLKSIPRPEYPIQVFTGAPPAFSLEAQRNFMRWSHERGYFLPDPIWLNGPSTDGINETVWPYLERLGCKHDEDVSIEFLVDGGFNRVYTIQTTARSYVFRVAFPVDPYYKTEADVATSELVRHFTTIPVPTTYAYDSSTYNPMGFEWILMDKVTSGKKLEDCWEVLGYDTKCRLAESAADWTAQLSKITSSKIGSIYMRSTEDNLDFYVGRCVNNLLTQETRLLYDVPRGSFESLQDYYAALLSVAELDIRNTTLAYMSGTFQFEETSSKFIGTFLDQDVFFRMREPYDKPDSELMKDRINELDLLASGLERLQEALPEWCAETDILRGETSLSTMTLAPLLFLTCVPDFMDSAEEPDEPEQDDVYRPEFANPEEEAELIKDNEEWYTRHLNDYQCTMLRHIYRETLRSLNSALSEAVWEDMPEFDRELLEHIHCFSAQAEDHREWVNSKLGVEINAEEPPGNLAFRGSPREERDGGAGAEGHGQDGKGELIREKGQTRIQEIEHC